MKNWKQYGFLIFFAIALLIIACNGNGETDPICTCPEGTTHEPNEKCCEGINCNCSIAVPTIREFTIDFSEIIFRDDMPQYTSIVTIIDNRTACGSKDLEEMGILRKIEQEIIGAYEVGNGPVKGRFRNVFLNYDGSYSSLTIFIENHVDYYNYIALDSSDLRKMTFHITWLQENPEDIQQKITVAVGYMNGFYVNFSYPYTTSTITLSTGAMGTNNETVSIYYTLDGSEPTANSTLYTVPFNIAETTTVKAILISTYYDSILTSIMYSQEYIIK
jgi:hypothetical protein